MVKQHIHNFVYVIENKMNSMKYIGTKTSDKDISNTPGFGIGYYSSLTGKSGDEFRKDQKEHPEKFKYTILKDYNNYQDMMNEEVRLHSLYNVDKNPMFYNRAKQTSSGFTSCCPDEETRRKMSMSHKGSHRSEETKRKMSESRRRVVEQKKKLGIVDIPWNKGKKMSEEFCYRLHLLRKDKGMKGEKNPMYGVKRKTKVCEYCGKEICELNYTKWHGKLCKENPDFELYKSERQVPYNKGKKCTEEQRLKNIENSKLSSWHSKKKCEYCGKEVDCGNYKQWHGEKCKYKPEDNLL